MQSEENIPAGQKRFEFRLPKTTSKIWVSIEGKGQFYKPPEQQLETCFYIDLPQGEHRVTVHGEIGKAEIGLQTGLKIFEYGQKTELHWYRSLDYVCGGLGQCTKEVIESWIDFQRKLPRGVLDPCGSTMIRGVSYQGERKERQLPEFESLTMNLTLKIYSFETYKSPGSKDCIAPIKNR
jgi:hypothetical protein